MLKERMQEYAELVNKALDSYIIVEEKAEKKLLEAMKYSLEAGGKRIRPMLVLEGCRLFRKDFEKALPFACALEMVHTFSLIHDDLPAIDNDDLRRGKPTNHKVFGESTAILAGDGLLDFAYTVIAKELQNLEDIERKIKAFEIFSTCTFQMIQGEFVDISLEGKQIRSEELYHMHDYKTAALLKAALTMGAVLGGASSEEIEQLEEYAEKIGLAFQIKDDILSFTGDEKTLGKPIGNDKERGKNTFVTVLGLEKAKKILEETVQNALKILSKFTDIDTVFLKELAVFIKERNF
ncbi:MAG: polyprenyl synthetase family protein [Clostridia bacterium]|nr:polyprenyl synthetase family protein [Clostridia bacterium]